MTYRQTTLGLDPRKPRRAEMTFRERIEAICRHEPVDRIVFQPRLESWLLYGRKHDTLPAEYRNMADAGVYADLNCSFRPYHFFNNCLRTEYSSSIKLEESTRQNAGKTEVCQRWSTPAGEIEKVWTHGEDSRHISGFPVKCPEDFKVLEYILREQDVSWDSGLFDMLDFYVAGDCTAPALFIPRVNIMRLSVEWMGFEQTNYALCDYPAAMRGLVKAINESDEQVLSVVADSPIELVNYGDNIDCNIISPPLLEEFILPAYQRRAEVLKPAGKFLYAHWDGSLKTLLPYAQKSYLDGLEALTPLPQGDVTLDEIKMAVGDEMVMIDILPMLSFMPGVPATQFEDEVYRALELFAPNIILGVSDEVSPVCDIERVRRAAEIVNQYEIH